MTQVYGVWALGRSYFGKFFQFGALINGGIFGIINFAVGFLELLLEFAKILSFSFRLFGNIFAGTLLLSIVGALTAVIDAAWAVPVRNILWHHPGICVLPAGNDVHQHGAGQPPRG